MNTTGFTLVCLILIGAGSLAGMVQSDVWYCILFFFLLFAVTLWVTRGTADTAFFTLCAGTLLTAAIGQADLLIAVGVQGVILGLVCMMTSLHSKGEIRMFLIICLPLFALCAGAAAWAGHTAVLLLLLVTGCAIALGYVRILEYRLSSGLGGNG